MLGGIEAGGTKFVCVVGASPDRIAREARFPTRDPAATIADAVAFFRDAAADGHVIDALGVASFGPVELRPGHPRHGWITTTPKPGWSGTDLVGPLRDALAVPVGFDTDVTGAALGEGRLGAARGLRTFVYVTVGTGIGGGAVVGGVPVHGLPHPEMGHVSVARLPGDEFPGICPFHGDCLEGMACGPAMAARWGRPAEELSGADLERAVATEAHYLAAGLRNVVYALAPERIVLGGGVAGLPGLLPALRGRLVDALAGYPGLPEQAADDFVVPPGLGAAAGAAGALVLAERARTAG
ncbi:MAG: ROK family protein [Thermoleophilia bacterium]